MRDGILASGNRARRLGNSSIQSETVRAVIAERAAIQPQPEIGQIVTTKLLMICHPLPRIQRFMNFARISISIERSIFRKRISRIL